MSKIIPDKGYAHLVTGSLDTTVKIWNESNFDLLHTLRGHSLGVISVDIEPKGICNIFFISENF